MHAHTYIYTCKRTNGISLKIKNHSHAIRITHKPTRNMESDCI